MTENKKNEIDNKIVYRKEFEYGLEVVRNVGTYDKEPYDSVKIRKDIFPFDRDRGRVEIKVTEDLVQALNKAREAKV